MFGRYFKHIYLLCIERPCAIDTRFQLTRLHYFLMSLDIKSIPFSKSSMAFFNWAMVLLKKSHLSEQFQLNKQFNGRGKKQANNECSAANDVGETSVICNRRMERQQQL